MPSDYGYATSGGGTTSRDACLNAELYNWDSLSDCYNNNWLYDSSNNRWTLTTYSGYSFPIFSVSKSGFIRRNDANFANFDVSPVLYLSSNVKITGGTGSSDDPYQLSL